MEINPARLERIDALIRQETIGLLVSELVKQNDLQAKPEQVRAMVEEQAQTLMRTAFSPIVRECGDLSAGIFDLKGRMLAQAVRAGAGAEAVADAGALERFDSAALAVLLECRREALALGKSFRVQAMPVRLRELATLYGVMELLPG